MLETSMMLKAERAAGRRRQLVADPLLARSVRLNDKCTYTEESRAAPRTLYRLAPPREAYTQAA